MTASTVPDNTTGFEDDPDPDTALEPRSTGVNATLSALLLLIVLTALVGNVLVIVAVCMFHRLKDEVANLFIINLSITDLSSAAVVMVNSVVAVSADRWVQGSAWCSVVCGANYCFIIVSMLTLCFISLDRYVAINHSLRYHAHVTRRRVLMLIAFSWLQGCAFGLVPMLCGWIDYDYWEATCAIQWHRYGTPVLTYVVVAFVLCFLLPSVVLTVAYCKVFRTVTKIKPNPVIHLVSQPAAEAGQDHQHGDPSLQRGASPAPPPRPRATRYSESSKAMRGLLIVVVAYFVCMTPFSATKLYKVSVPRANSLAGYINMVATFFQYMSSAVNPLIYGLFRRDFQQAFIYILWRMVRQRNAPSTCPSISAT